MALLDREERMECREFERLIPGFLKGELDYPTLKRFLAHRESCSECREELDIQFLVAEGMQHLEEGNAFDLQSELEQRLEETGRKVRVNSAFLYFGSAMELVAAGLLVWAFVWILL
nr:zf-HC2 domain-containing protein [uncultured Acetatifactor sp.]